MNWTSIIICFAVFIRGFGLAEKAETLSCLNGGTFQDNRCICKAEFTGKDCSFKIGDLDTLHQRFESCFSGDGVISGKSNEDLSTSGSGQESGGEGVCEDQNKFRYNGECLDLLKFSGSVTWKTNRPLTGLTNASSSDYVTLMKESQCAIEEIFNDLPIARLSITSPIDRNGTVQVHFRVDTASTLKSLSDALKTANDSSDVLSSYQLTDFNECTSNLTNDCDVAAECVNLEGSYACKCPTTHIDMSSNDMRPGRLCKNVCVDKEGKDFCMNDAVCLAQNDGRICNCPRGYAGERCDHRWLTYFHTMIGLIVGIGILLVLFLTIIVMMHYRKRISRDITKSNSGNIELSRSNGDYCATNQDNGCQIRGISNPYFRNDAGITVARKTIPNPYASNEVRASPPKKTEVKSKGSSDEEEDKL